METATSILKHLEDRKEKKTKPETEKNPFSSIDEENKKIGEQLDKITAEQILQVDPEDLRKKEEQEKKESLVKAEKPETPKSKSYIFIPNINFWLIFGAGLFVVIIAVAVIRYLNERNYKQVSVVETSIPPPPRTRDFDIGDGRIIQIPI